MDSRFGHTPNPAPRCHRPSQCFTVDIVRCQFGRHRTTLVEYFKNNVPQRQIAEALQISSSTVHNIIKSFRETGEISLRKGQGRRPLLHARGLRALRWHCITHRHDSVIDITKWAQEYFQKPLCHLQMPTKALSCKKEAICEHGPEAPSCPVGQGSFKMDCFKVEKCSMVRRVKIWHSCWKSRSSGLKRRETFQRVISVQFKSQHLWWYGGA